MSAKKSYWPIVLGVVALAAVLVYVALRYEERLERIELLERAPTATPLVELPDGVREAASGQTVYVPAYSHVYARGGSEHLLEVTLSIRNADLERAIVVRSIRYYDTEGRLLREYLDAPVVLRPLASTDFLVEQRDRAGGAGANFLVDWVAEEAVTEPVIETIMVSSEGNRAFAFTRSGFPVAEQEPDGSR